jgi:TolB-like protein
MKFSTNFSSKPFSVLCTVLLCLSGCTATNNQTISGIDDHPTAVEEKLLTAVLPLTNRSATPAPLEDIRQLLINSFEKQGLSILDNETLERFIVSHRVRYVGGTDETTARDLRIETGADAVLITAVEMYSDIFPPKIALTSRLVSTGNNPQILWMDGVSLTGDDSVGILQLSLIDDPRELLEKAVGQLSTSLGGYLAGKVLSTGSQRDLIKFWPKVFYLSPTFEPEWKHTVAVVPFVNLSGRKFAGEIIALNFIRQMMTRDNFTVIEPGITRDALLRARVVMSDGISLADAYDLLRNVHADLILAGTLFDYQDYTGPLGQARVDFSALVIERQSRGVVWSCRSHDLGDFGVFLFDWGKINTAHKVASEMVAAALETLVEQD